MEYDPDKHHRRSIRLKGYDYSQAGAYFVTVCIQNRECLLGDVSNGEMHPSDAGEMVIWVWDDLTVRYPAVGLDTFVVMPNHMHGIIIVGAGLALPCHEGAASGAPTLGDVVRSFKSLSAIQVNHRLMRTGPLWQRNYYERVIRNEAALNNTRQYILNNPLNWDHDENNPRILQEAQSI